MSTPSRRLHDRLRILVLEDPSRREEVLDRELQRLPFLFTLHRAGSRAGLLDKLRTFVPDIILYHDWRKGMSALEALGFSRRHAPRVPFIIVDGELDERIARQCLNAGASEILTSNTLIRLGPAITGALDRSSAPEPPPAETLHENAEILRLIVENVSDLIVVLDVDGKRIYNSPSCTALFGNPAAVQGTDSFCEIHPDDRDYVRDVFRRTVAGGVGQRAEYRIVREDGAIRHIESQGNVVRDSVGNLSRIVIVSRDITERREAEETLSRSNIRFRSLIENSSDAIAVIDANGLIVYASPSTERVLGYTPDEFTGLNGLALIHPDERERSTALLLEVISEPGRSLLAQYRFLHKNGSWRWIDAVGKNLIADPDVRGIVVNYRDVTENRKAIEALQSSDERYRAFVGQSTEGIWRFELHEAMPPSADDEEQMEHILRHAYVAQCNDIMARMFGLACAEEMQGNPLREFMPASDPHNVVHLLTFIRSGYRLLDAESTTVDAGSTARHHLNTIVGVVEDGLLVRAWGTRRDITEQKQAEGKIAILAHALRSISEGVYLTDLKGRIVFANQALLEMYGYTEGELTGRNVRTLQSVRRQDEQTQGIHEASLSAGWIGELTHSRKDGSELKVSVASSLVRGESGEAIALMGVVRDITDRKRAELLQDAVYRIAQAADAAPSLSELYPAVHRIIQEVMPASNFYIALYDDREDLLYFPYFVDEVDVPLPPMKPGKGVTAFVLRTGKSLLCTELVWEKLVETGDVELVGEPSPIWLGVPLIVANRTIGVMVVQHYTDAAAYGPIEQHMLEFVSSQVAKAIERKRSDEALRESEERYRRMFEDDLTGDFISTPEGKILACNPAFARIFGFDSVPEALRCDCRLLHKDLGVRGTLFDLVRQRRKLEYYEMELRRKDGRPIYVVANLIGTFDEQERLVTVKGYLFDNTERKRLEDQLLQAQKMEAVGQLASGIAHDFNNVMSVALSAAQMIRTAGADEQTTRYAKMIEETTLRGAAIAKQLLQFSRVEAAKLSPLSLGHIVNEVKKILDHSLSKTVVIRLEINLKQGVILGDEGQIHQLLLNLCINARDAMTSPSDKEGTGTLTISLESASGDLVSRQFGSREADEYAVLRIADTGTGITPDVVRRMFDPFFTTKGIGKGTGLGLSIVHGIVRGHHGQIDVDTSPGKGTTFSVYLPIIAQQTVSASRSSAEPSGGRGETILVIEDEEILRTLMKEMLVRAGYRILEAKDGEEGVNVYRARREEIDVVVSDMGLPRLSGEQVFHELQQIEPRVRVIFSTGYISDEKRHDLLETGARRFIHKPYRVHEMLGVIREVLDAKE